MKGRNGIWNRKLTKKGVSDINRDVVVFAFFLFLSFCFWYINSLGKEMEADINYPFRYVNVPKDRIISNDMPGRLTFSLKGAGYSVLKLKVSGKKPQVLIDLLKVNYRRVPETKTPEYYIVTSGLIKSLTVQIRSGCEIIAVKPDTLFFTFSKAVTKANTGIIGSRLTLDTKK